MKNRAVSLIAALVFVPHVEAQTAVSQPALTPAPVASATPPPSMQNLTQEEKIAFIRERVTAQRLAMEKAAKDAKDAQEEATLAANKKKMEADMKTAYDVAKRAVYDSLKAPSTAMFQDYDPGWVKPNYNSEAAGILEGVRDFTVTVVVDAENGYGAEIRGAFNVRVYPDQNSSTGFSADIPIEANRP